MSDPNSNRTDEGVNYIRKNYPTRPNKERISPRKYKLMFVKQLTQSLTNQECADALGVAKRTYENHKKRKDSKNWIAKAEELLDDPVFVTRQFLKDEQVENFVELVTIAEAAKAAGDYSTAARIRTKIVEWAGVPEVVGRDGKGPSAGVTINLNVTREQMESPEVETEYEIIEADVEDD